MSLREDFIKEFLHSDNEPDVSRSGLLESGAELYSKTVLSSGEDIWDKVKFDINTPPDSPSRAAAVLSADSRWSADEEGAGAYCDVPDDLYPSPIEYQDGGTRDLEFPESPPGKKDNLSSILIHDCMWSGRIEHSFKSPEKSEPFQQNTTSSLHSPTLDIQSRCVDPTLVFPLSASDRSQGIETPSDTDDELDVVTVDTNKQKLSSSQQTRTVTFEHVGTRIHVRSALRSIKFDDNDEESVIVRRAPSKRGRSAASTVVTRPSPAPSRVGKKMKRELGVTELKSVAQKLKNDRRPSLALPCLLPELEPDSEIEGEGKRTQHNVLERKRRNDLKYSFFTLRDEVPEIKGQEKAAKVVILKEAKYHIMQLVKQHELLQSELQRQKARRDRLKKLVLAAHANHRH